MLEIVIRVEDLLGKRTLIVGEVGSGKTRLTARILEELVKKRLGDYVTVIDMAPESIGDIGGRLHTYTNAIREVRYLAPEVVYTPRLSGRTREEVITLAMYNAMNIRRYILEYIQNPTPILVINDLSIYFHVGDPLDIEECIEVASTFIGNGYYGKRLSEDRGSGISMREQILMEHFMRLMDVVYRL